MQLKMTTNDALSFADEWSRGMTLHEDSQGWRVVCMILAEEVRDLRERFADASARCVTLATVRGERDRLIEAIQLTLEENGHLADGDVCTLSRLKSALRPNA